MIKKISLWTIAFLVCFQLAAFADVVIGERTGTLVITNPDGTTLTLGPNDPLPAIPDGASIQVVNGVAQISTTGTTTVNITAGGRTFQLAVNTAVNLMFEPTGAVLAEVTAGQVTTTIGDGRVATIGANDQARLTSDGGIEAIKGEVTLTDNTGKTETLGSGSKVEGYTPPETPNTGNVDTQVQSEETSRDISPVKS